MQRAWDDGDAVLPVDPRLPGPARDALLAAARLDEPVDDGDALVIATSGSTGDPKLVVLTHAAVEASARATSARLDIDPTTDRWLACLPLAHVGGLSVVTRSLVTGTPCTVHDALRRGRRGASGRRGLHPHLARADRAGQDRPDGRSARSSSAARRRRPTARRTSSRPTGSPRRAAASPTTASRSTASRSGSSTGEIHVRGPMLLRAYRRRRTTPRTPTAGCPPATPASFDGRPAHGARPHRRPHHHRRRERVAGGGRAGRSPPTPGSPRWSWSAGPIPSGASASSRSSCRRDAAAPPSLDDLRDHVKEVLPAYAAPKVARARRCAPAHRRAARPVAP